MLTKKQRDRRTSQTSSAVMLESRPQWDKSGRLNIAVRLIFNEFGTDAKTLTLMLYSNL